MRLDQFLSQTAGLTRSQARAEIRAGRVQVDGGSVTDPAYKVLAQVPVTWAGQSLCVSGPRYLMLHKPAGLVCATRDGMHPVVLSCLPPAEAARVHIVGRLDIDTTGLLLLSDDGAWSHRITAPRSHCAKSYLADLDADLGAAGLAMLRAGVQLHGEKPLAPPLRVEPLTRRRIRLMITEGRYHQVKRMFAVVGRRVIGLHREAIGGLHLDPALAPGEWRELLPAERTLVFAKMEAGSGVLTID